MPPHETRGAPHTPEPASEVPPAPLVVLVDTLLDELPPPVDVAVVEVEVLALEDAPPLPGVPFTEPPQAAARVAAPRTRVRIRSDLLRITLPSPLYWLEDWHTFRLEPSDTPLQFSFWAQSDWL